MLLNPNFPFKPSSSPFFYGWVIIFASMLGIVMSMSGQTNGVSVFNEPLMAALNLTRTELSLIYCIGTLISGLNMTLGGRLIDRFGVRRLIVHASVGMGLVLLMFSHVVEMSQWIQDTLGFISITIVVWVLLTALFALLRFSGQGMMVLMSRQMLGKWFDRKRGMASAFAGVLISMAFGLTPKLFQMLIDAFSWQGAWCLMSILAGIVMPVCAWFLFRDNPEECGLSMDGIDAAAAEKKKAEGGEEISFSLHEARSTLVFWIIVLVLAMQGLVGTAIPYHIGALAVENGLSKHGILDFFIPVSMIAPAVGFLVGWACDRYPMRYILCVFCVFQIMGFISFAFVGADIGWVLAVIGIGVSSGFFGPLSTVAMPYFFGRKHLGEINGAMMKMMVIGSAVGPLSFSLTRDIFGTFHIAFFASALLSVVLLVFSMRVVNPDRPEA